MNIQNVRSKVSDEIIHLFEHTDDSAYLNVYDRESLVRDIGSVKSKEELVTKIHEKIGESFDVDKNAFEDGRVLKLTAPIDINNKQKNINQVREGMQRIECLTELSNLSGRVREPESVEDTVQYRFVYVYQ